MCTPRIVASLVAVFLFSALAGIPSVEAQDVRVEVGGGWAIPSSSVDMRGAVEGSDEEGFVPVDPGSGLHGYAFVGLVWTVSSNFALGAGLRVQHSQMRGDASDLASGIRGCREEECQVSNDPDGRFRAATFEGRITLTSAGRIKPYFLVGLGIVRTTVDGARVTAPDGTGIQFEEAEVTDAGGDLGFGARMPLAGGLSLNAEIRATGSLPGAKENAVTTFPFSLGLSYGF